MKKRPSAQAEQEEKWKRSSQQTKAPSAKKQPEAPKSAPARKSEATAKSTARRAEAAPKATAAGGFAAARQSGRTAAGAGQPTAPRENALWQAPRAAAVPIPSARQSPTESPFVVQAPTARQKPASLQQRMDEAQALFQEARLEQQLRRLREEDAQRFLFYEARRLEGLDNDAAMAAQLGLGLTRPAQAGLDANALSGIRMGNGIARTSLKADAIRATPEWQALAERQSLTGAGLDANALSGIRMGNGIADAAQKARAIRATPEWQALAERQSLTGAGLDANALSGIRMGNGIANAAQKARAIRATPEGQALAERQSLTGAGLDANALSGVRMGERIGQAAKRLTDETSLAPGASAWDYLADRAVNGAQMSMEGARNGLVDWAWALTQADLAQQEAWTQQYAWMGDLYQKTADDTKQSVDAVRNALPQAAEGLRSHRAAERAQELEAQYQPGGWYRLVGDVASAAGQYAPAMAANLLAGGMGGMPYLFTSAKGNASAAARAGGADENTAFLYGLGSGGIEVATEKLFGGIPGLGKGKLDDVVAGLAQTERGRGALKLAIDLFGEGAEESIGTIADAYLAKLWNGDERGVWQTFWETLPDAVYDGMVGMLSSAGLNAPGYAAGALQRGGTAARERVEREAVDRRQFEEYKAVLGKNAPKTFAEFEELKYNDPEKWEDTKQFAGYKQLVPEATEADFRKYQQVKATGIIGTIRVPSEKIDASKLVFRDAHAARHGCTVEEARGYIESAVCSIRRERWDKIESINYYSKDGATYIDAETKEIKASFPKSNFDPTTKTVVEVFE